MPKLTEAKIRSMATAQSFSRGQDYYSSGAVYDLQRRGNILLAEVEGSSYEAYRVSVKLDEGGVIDVDCSCPYDWGGICKHIVAVLLTYVHRQDDIKERPTVDTLLADLDRSTLLGLLTDLLSRHPDLIDWVEGQLTLRPRAVEGTAQPVIGGTPQARRTPIDTSAIRRQVRYQMRPSHRTDYHATGGVVGALSEIVAQARQFLEGDDGESALTILAAIAEETIPGWEIFDDSDGEFGGFFEELGQAMSEAILTTDLSPKAREQWIEDLQGWQAELDDYGIDVAFEAAIAAAEQGWDYEPLQRAMQGNITEKGAWEEEDPWYADVLAEARLNVLERQGRFEEYLNLAEVEGQTERYLTMLVKTGRAEEATNYPYLATAGEALTLAQALRDHGHALAALPVAERGLALAGTKVHLATWLRDFAASLGDANLALRAAHMAFEESASLDNYQAARSLAGTDWPVVQQELLAQLAEKRFIYGRIDIYLHEGMIDEAIRAVDAQDYVGYGTIEQVVDAAWQTHPDWVIRQCKRQAESIMDSGKSKYYHHALRWLEKARNAYRAAGQEEDWCTYCKALIDKHHRKYSLVPGLRQLL